MTEYRKSEIAKILEESPRKIQFWVDSELVRPDVVPPSGRGKAVIFSDRNLIEFEMIRILHSKYGFKLGEIKILLEVLRGEHEDVTEDVDFDLSDFYTNADWGTKRELIVTKTLPGDLDSYTFFIAIIDKNGTFRQLDGKEIGLTSILKEDEDNAEVYSTTIILLGSIKNLAVKFYQDYQKE